jgi:hypothetical protein
MAPLWVGDELQLGLGVNTQSAFCGALGSIRRSASRPLLVSMVWERVSGECGQANLRTANQSFSIASLVGVRHFLFLLFTTQLPQEVVQLLGAGEASMLSASLMFVRPSRLRMVSYHSALGASSWVTFFNSSCASKDLTSSSNDSR